MVDQSGARIAATRASAGALAARIALAAAAVGLVWLGTVRFGPGLSPDSASYLSIARSLATGAGVAMTGGGPVAYWPPLLPLLLSAAYPLGIDPIAWGRVVNALLHGAVVFTAPLVLPASIRPWPIALGLSAMVALAPPLVRAARFVSSEPLFVVLVILFLAALGRALDDDRWRWVCAAAVCAALSALARYAGVTVILTGLVCLVARAAGGRRRAIGRAAVFAVVAGLPLLAFLARNRIVTGRLTGRRPWAEEPVLVHLGRFGATLLDWIAPGAPAIVPVTALLAMLAVVSTAVHVADGERRARLRARLRAATPVLAFLGIYSAWLLTAASLVHFDEIDHRLLAPIFVPLAATVLLVVHWTWPPSPRASRHSRPLAWVAAGAVVAWIAGVVAWTVPTTRAMIRHGAGGFASARWMESPLTYYLRERPPEGLVYSNDPKAYFVLIRRGAAWSPARGPGDRILCSADVAQLLGRLRGERPIFLVWWNQRRNPDLVPQPVLAGVVALDPVMTTVDGAVFRVTATATGRERWSAACGDA